MQPSHDEIDAAVFEEADALKNFAQASKEDTKASLKLKAARCRLQLARRNKNALLNDLMVYSN